MRKEPVNQLVSRTHDTNGDRILADSLAYIPLQFRRANVHIPKSSSDDAFAVLFVGIVKVEVDDIDNN